MTAVISRYYSGWYVQAVDIRHAQDEIFAGPATYDVSAVPPVTRSGEVAVSEPVRVPGSVIEVPEVELRKRVKLVGGRVVVGQVRCMRCEVELAIEGSQRPPELVRVRGRALLKLPNGARRGAAVRVSLDGRVLAHEFDIEDPSVEIGHCARSAGSRPMPSRASARRRPSVGL